ncbi:alpha-1-antitrypsin-like protein GS55-LT, partial [Marmota marmota marmota]|uniref:alpha-1-antitrypsin-like protein GS55-LT n=1 Tax=Marmota marmota marmota TaxID=9994 RepID=UPI002093426B
WQLGVCRTWVHILPPPLNGLDIGLAISPLWDVTVLTCHGQSCQDLEIPADPLVLNDTHPITQDGAEVGEELPPRQAEGASALLSHPSLPPTCCHPPSLCPGTWEKPFKVDRTMEQDFHVDEATTVRVPMMNHLGIFDLHYCPTLSSMMLKMNYLGDVTAIFIMPKVGRMEYVEDTITKEFLDKFLKKDYTSKATVHFPKLSISGTIDLKSVLTSLGITKVFSHEADLSGITEDAPLRVSQALHKAVLTIDERGTEDEGDTVKGPMALTLAPQVKFNSPFLVIIYEHSTRSPLFVGKVVNPTQQ